MYLVNISSSCSSGIFLITADEEPYESMKEKTDDIIEMKDIENERIELIKEKRMRDEEHYKDPVIKLIFDVMP